MADLAGTSLMDWDCVRELNYANPPLPLSPRERECLLWAARGKTFAEIAAILGLAFGTVKAHLDVARYKLGSASLAQATAAAMARGIFTSDDLADRT